MSMDWNCKKNVFSAVLRKEVATKAQRHELKNAMHFPLRLSVLVANPSFVKNQFIRLLKYLSFAYPDLKEGIGTVALLQAMDKSLQTGLPVRIKDVLKEYGLDGDLEG